MATAQLMKVETSGKWKQGLQTSIKIRDFEPIIVDEPKTLGGTDEGPNPVELVLASLSSCASIMIAFISKELNFTYTDIEFKNEGILDLRGLQGVKGVSPHFQSVEFNVVFHTEESEERIEALKNEVERRCPVLNLLADAGVKVEGEWVKA